MGERQAGASVAVDQPRTCAATFRSSIYQGRKTFYLSRFHSFSSADPANRGLNDDSFSVAEQNVYSGHESAVELYRSVLHDALALCLYWPGDQAILLHISRRISRAR